MDCLVRHSPILAAFDLSLVTKTFAVPAVLATFKAVFRDDQDPTASWPSHARQLYIALPSPEVTPLRGNTLVSFGECTVGFVVALQVVDIAAVRFLPEIFRIDSHKC